MHFILHLHTIKSLCTFGGLDILFLFIFFSSFYFIVCDLWLFVYLPALTPHRYTRYRRIWHAHTPACQKIPPAEIRPSCAAWNSAAAFAHTYLVVWFHFTLIDGGFDTFTKWHCAHKNSIPAAPSILPFPLFLLILLVVVQCPVHLVCAWTPLWFVREGVVGKADGRTSSANGPETTYRFDFSMLILQNTSMQNLLNAFNGGFWPSLFSTCHRDTRACLLLPIYALLFCMWLDTLFCSVGTHLQYILGQATCLLLDLPSVFSLYATFPMPFPILFVTCHFCVLCSYTALIVCQTRKELSHFYVLLFALPSLCPLPAPFPLLFLSCFLPAVQKQRTPQLIGCVIGFGPDTTLPARLCMLWLDIVALFRTKRTVFYYLPSTYSCFTAAASFTCRNLYYLHLFMSCGEWKRYILPLRIAFISASSSRTFLPVVYPQPSLGP